MPSNVSTSWITYSHAKGSYICGQIGTELLVCMRIRVRYRANRNTWYDPTNGQTEYNKCAALRQCCKTAAPPRHSAQWYDSWQLLLLQPFLIQPVFSAACLHPYGCPSTYCCTYTFYCCGILHAMRCCCCCNSFVVVARRKYFRTAVPFWGQTTQISSSLSPKRDCGPEGVNSYIHVQSSRGRVRRMKTSLRLLARMF